MESSLHRTLKEQFGPGSGGRSEVTIGGYRVDAIDGEGRLVEVQSAPLSALRKKLADLLPLHPIRVIKPIVRARKVVRRATPLGKDLSSRWSPRKGSLLDVFDELVGIARLFPHPNLRIEVLGVSVAEIRRSVTKRRRREQVFDRELIEQTGGVTLQHPSDLWSLIERPAFDRPFTTADLAEKLGRSLSFAQRVAYCLRHAGAVEDLGKTSRFNLYACSPLHSGRATREVAYDSPGAVPAGR